MTSPAKQSKHHRYELVHGDDADFVAYQRQLGNGVGRHFRRG